MIRQAAGQAADRGAGSPGPGSPGQPSRLLLSAGIISVAYLLSRIMGYVREAFLAARFGTSYTTDAYLVAQDLPGSLFLAATAALSTVFIPIYQEQVLKRGASVAGRLAGTALAVAVGTAVALAGLGWLVAPALIPLLVPGLPSEVQALSSHLTRIMMPMTVFLAFTAIATAVLHAHRHFAAPAFVPLASNLTVVAALALISGPEQVGWVAMAAVLGALFGSLIQVRPLLSLGLELTVGMGGSQSALSGVGRLFLPVLLTMGGSQLQGFVDRFMASSLAEGSIAALGYAQRVSTLPYGIIGVAVATVLYPGLAEAAAAGRTEELRRTVSHGLRIMCYVLVPMAVGLFFFREPIVALFFQRGAFDVEATAITALALRFLSVGVLFFGWLDFLNRSFFALRDGWTPMWTALVMVAANALLNALLVPLLGLGGLALGTALSTAMAGGLLLARLRQRIGSLGIGAIARTALLSLVTSVAGALLGSWLFGLVDGDGLMIQVARLFGALGAVVLVHVGLSYLIGLGEAQEIVEMVRRRRK